MDSTKVDLTVPFQSREIFKLVFSECHGNTDVLFEFRLRDNEYFFSVFSVYLIKTKVHICINELPCNRGYFVGLFFREIGLKSEEQKQSN